MATCSEVEPNEDAGEDSDENPDSETDSGADAWSCGDPVDYQGYDYETVQIGEQCWFAENLRASCFSNGDSIVTSLSDSTWASADEGAYGQAQFPHVGLLYNWFAVIDARDLCPGGWGVPQVGHFNSLRGYADQLSGELGTGHALKVSTDPPSVWTGTNETGFSGLPTGLIQGGGGTPTGYAFGLWRTADEWNAETAQTFRLYAYDDGAGMVNQSKQEGQAVRCIKDSE